MKPDKAHIHNFIFLVGFILSIVALPFSVLLCHAGIFLISINWIVEGKWQPKWKLAIQHRSLFVFFAFFFWHLAGVFYSEDVSNAWYNIEKKFTFAVVPLILATTTLTYKNKELFLRAFVVSCLIASFACLGSATYRTITNINSSTLNFGIVQPAQLLANPLLTNHWQEFSYVALSSGIGIHPTYLSVFIIFSMVVLVSEYVKKSLNEHMSLLLIGYLTIFLALLSTRIALIVILIIAIVGIGLIFLRNSFFSFKQFVKGAGFVLLFLVLSALNPVSLYRDFQEINDTPLLLKENANYSNSTEIRWALWWTGKRTALVTNPIIGAGTGDLHRSMQKTSQSLNVSNDINTNDPHNQYLYSLISLGLIGLLLLLGCYLFTLRKAWRRRDLLNLSFIGLVLIVSITESFLESQKGIVFFVLFQSLFAFVGSGIPETQDNSVS